MSCLGKLSVYSLFLLSLSFVSSHAANFEIHNNCQYTVWAAAWAPGAHSDGNRLAQGQTWNQLFAPGTSAARIWGRTGCNSAGNGCRSGNCPGGLRCTGSGEPPATLAEFSLNQGNNDYYDISLVDGFNIPMGFYPRNGGCRQLTCAANINLSCPNELKRPGGCLSACKASGNCGPSSSSNFFKQKCPDAYSYPGDNTATAGCAAGTDYRVVFCP
ncbi:hypothetical protein L6164_001106 [Bauhinia variegata]|uniref:Uncharacterized protein n=1 Tax=Bauhinia variegata TaxID=167791 RepID=A0ACB9QAN4_BAUVA|nr:hypothetical protein L6164_001106 [Bauhinia variegata]